MPSETPLIKGAGLSLQPQLAHPTYRADIDGLRAVAVLSVVIYHAFPNALRGGFIGVDIFFVISGFLISTIIFKSLERGTFSFTEFYARRIKRIFPALLLVLAASLICGWFVLLADQYKQLGKHVAAGAGFISNLILWGEAGYFDSSAETKPLLHLWSLGIEEQFYIAWPFAVWLAWKRRFNLLLICLAFAVLSFGLNMAGIVKDPVATFYSPLTRFWELLCGSLLAWLMLYWKSGLNSQPDQLSNRLASLAIFTKLNVSGESISNAMSLFGVALLAIGFWSISKSVNFPGIWAAIPVLGAVLVISAGPSAWINRHILSHRLAVWVGLISYPLYLWHWPLLSFAQIVEGDEPSRLTRLAAVALSIVLAWLTCRLIERPLRFGSGKFRVAMLAALMAVIGGAGFFIYERGGLASRFPTDLLMTDKELIAERQRYLEGSRDRNFETAQRTIVVFGDSQGFDIYKALQNDDALGLKMFDTSFQCTAFDRLKLGMTDVVQSSCDKHFAGFLQSDALKQADTLIYSIYWSHWQEPQDALFYYQAGLKKIRDANPKIRIVLMGPKPLLGMKWQTINAIIRPHRSLLGMNEFLNRIRYIRNEDTAYARALSEQLGVTFVDVNEIFCAANCPFYVDDKFTYFDQNHWTELGGQIFYRNLKARPDLAGSLF